MLRVVTPRDEKLPAYLATAQAVELARGFYDREWDGEDHFHWMSSAAALSFAAAPIQRHLEISVLSDYFDLSQELTATTQAGAVRFALTHGWMQLSVSIPASSSELRLTTNKIVPRALHPDDVRSLAVRVKAVRLHADGERHRHVANQHANAQLNTREMLDGATRLESTPPALGIDMYGACNVKPPCVYCEWDWAKELEGNNVDAPFTRQTLEDYGSFFDNAHSLTNCSIGEPFMMKNFDELLEIFGRQGKLLELTTNGQILTDRNIERLLGRSVDLYVSLDAGTSETYSKLRNDKWDRILVNLRRLIELKKTTDDLPRIHLVFMPMRVNLHELEEFVRLCADLGVDRMVLRPLNYSEWIGLKWERDGYTFDYQRELLPFDELVAASARAARLCRRYGVPLSDQMDFGSEESLVQEFGGDAGGQETDAVEPAKSSAEPAPPAPAPSGSPEPVATAHEPAREQLPVVVAADTSPEDAEPDLGEGLQPICLEPWKKLYVLRRGVLPCSYGSPLAPMQDYRSVWNSEQMQHIRRELAAHRFPKYCLDAPSCPIVRRHIHAHKLPVRQKIFLAVRNVWHRFDRATRQGWQGALARPVKMAVHSGLALTRGLRGSPSASDDRAR